MRDTVWGVKWPVPSNFQIFLIIFVIFMILFIYFLVKYKENLKNNIIHENQMLLFKAKHLGLTNFQYKILKGISDIANTDKPYMIINNPSLFEKAIGSFIHYIHTLPENHKSILNISRDIVITYEKVYNHSDIQKPIDDVSQISTGRLIYFITESKSVFVAKIISNSQSCLKLLIFRDKKYIKFDILQGDIEMHIWRSGDGEYKFKGAISEIQEDRIICVSKTKDLEKISSVRTPFVDVIIPCDIITFSGKENEHKKSLSTTIYKFNEHEFVIRTKHKLEFSKNYQVEFSINDFNIVSNALILADRTISQENTNYYTFKFQNISDAAKSIILKYITDRL